MVTIAIKGYNKPTIKVEDKSNSELHQAFQENMNIIAKLLENEVDFTNRHLSVDYHKVVDKIHGELTKRETVQNKKEIKGDILDFYRRDKLIEMSKELSESKFRLYIASEDPKLVEHTLKHHGKDLNFSY